MSDLGSFQGVGPITFGGVDEASPVSFATIDSAANKHSVGDRATEKGEEYVFVHNAGASDASVGYGLVLSSLSGYSLTISSLSGTHQPMCVVKHATIPAGGFGWGLVRGISEIAVESTAATGAAQSLTDDGIFATFVVSTGMLNPQAHVLSSGTGVSTGFMPKAYVRCFG